MKRLARQIGHWLHRSLPKWNHAVVWCWPDGEDNGIALEQGLQSRGIRRVVLLVSDAKKPASWEIGGKTIRVKKNSPHGILCFLTARYVFFTHPCFTRTYPSNVVAVNVWHGMPIKKIGSMLPGDGEMACRFTTVTSPFWGGIMRRAMNPGGLVPDTGLPRNDRLFSDPDITRKKIGINKQQKLIVWLPTYRKSMRGLPRMDGLAAGNPFEMPDVDPEKLNEWLASHDALMIVKPHPMAEHGIRKSFSHLRIIDHQWLCDRRVSLYELLGASNALLSDISSAVIDYLLLDRPIIHTFADMRAYQQSRGFTVEPIDDYLAGTVVVNGGQLVEALNKIISGMDPDAEKRRRLKSLSHTHVDCHSTARILDLVGLNTEA